MTTRSPLMPGTIADSWHSFIAAVFPGQTPPTDVQRQEMRRAFYAGFLACHGSLVLLGDDGVEDDAAMNWLVARGEELVQFTDDVMAGRA